MRRSPFLPRLGAVEKHRVEKRESFEPSAFLLHPITKTTTPEGCSRKVLGCKNPFFYCGTATCRSSCWSSQNWSAIWGFLYLPIILFWILPSFYLSLHLKAHLRMISFLVASVRQKCPNWINILKNGCEIAGAKNVTGKMSHKLPSNVLWFNWFFELEYEWNSCDCLQSVGLKTFFGKIWNFKNWVKELNGMVTFINKQLLAIRGFHIDYSIIFCLQSFLLQNSTLT